MVWRSAGLPLGYQMQAQPVFDKFCLGMQPNQNEGICPFHPEHGVKTT